jgi:hypothetical protein
MYGMASLVFYFLPRFISEKQGPGSVVSFFSQAFEDRHFGKLEDFSRVLNWSVVSKRKGRISMIKTRASGSWLKDRQNEDRDRHAEQWARHCEPK